MPKNCPLGKIEEHACWGCAFEFGNSCIYNEMMEERKEEEKRRAREASQLKITIERIDDEEMKKFPYYWMISRGGANCGHGWSATEVEALQDACEYLKETGKVK